MPHKVFSPKGWRNPYKSALSKKSSYFLSSGKKKTRRWGKLLFFSIFLLFIILFFIFVANFGWTFFRLPSPDKLIEHNFAQSTTIYDRTGKNILYQIYGEQKRTLIGFDQIPEYLKLATIVIEDKNFYQHKGFDLTALIRTIWVNLRKGRKAQGGSTITQQLVKNVILTPEKTYTRKIKELILAYKIEKKFSKDEILKMYFNEIPYGSQAYGIEAAAQLYFNKHAKDLSLAEAALLAALPQAPTRLSPYGTHKDELIKRQQYILDLMVEEGYLEKADADEAKKENVLSKIVTKRENITAPHFVMYVKEILSEKYGEQTVEQGGLKVYTTLDLDKQKIAEAAIDDGVKKNEKNFKASNAGLVAIDPKSGEVLAMVGSKNFFDEKIDGQFNVTTGLRQPGSSFKPIVYATAFEKGFTPDTVLFDLETNFGPSGDGKDYIPQNYTGKNYGPIAMRKALSGSLNIPAVKTLYLAGINNVLDLANKMGYSTLKDRSKYGLSLVLGGGAVKLLEHVSAFGIFSQDGIKYDTKVILKIEDSQGKIVEENNPDQGERILDEQVAREINSILSDNSSRTFIFGPNSPLFLTERPVAAKTGTTNDFRDAWTIGYTPSLAAGVWIGNNDYSPMTKGADGSVVAAPIWHKFMAESLKNDPPETFTPPQVVEIDKPILKGETGNQIMVKIDKASGKLATEFTPPAFIEEKIYKEFHNILHYVNKDDPLGPVPDNPYNDYQYERWEKPVQEWASQQGFENQKPPTEYDDLHVPQNKPTASIVYPSENTEVNQNVITLQAAGFAPRGTISRIAFFIDGQKIDEARSPFYALANLGGLENGYHTLKVIAYDDIDNYGEKEITFKLNLYDQKSTILWLSPQNNSDVSFNSFPISFKVAVSSSKKISAVKLYYQKPNESEKKLLATNGNPDGHNLSITWDRPSDLQAGQYNFYCEAIDENNNSLSSDRLSINLTQ